MNSLGAHRARLSLTGPRSTGGMHRISEVFAQRMPLGHAGKVNGFNRLGRREALPWGPGNSSQNPRERKGPWRMNRGAPLGVPTLNIHSGFRLLLCHPLTLVKGLPENDHSEW